MYYIILKELLNVWSILLEEPFSSIWRSISSKGTGKLASSSCSFSFFFVVFETKQSVFKNVETIHPSQRLGRRGYIV